MVGIPQRRSPGPLRSDPEIPRALPGSRPRRAQRLKQCRLAGDPINQPKRRGVRSDRSEQRPLTPDRPKVRQTVPTVGEHDREIPHHPTGVMPPATLTHPRKRPGQRTRQPNPVSDLTEQRGPGVRDQTLSVRRDIYREIAPIALHLQGEPVCLSGDSVGAAPVVGAAGPRADPADVERNCFTHDPG